MQFVIVVWLQYVRDELLGTFPDDFVIFSGRLAIKRYLSLSFFTLLLSHSYKSLYLIYTGTHIRFLPFSKSLSAECSDNYLSLHDS